MSNQLPGYKPLTVEITKSGATSHLGRSITPSYASRASASSSFNGDGGKRASSNHSNREECKSGCFSPTKKENKAKISHKAIQSNARGVASKNKSNELFFSNKPKPRGRSFSPSLLSDKSQIASKSTFIKS